MLLRKTDVISAINFHELIIIVLIEGLLGFKIH